MPPSKREFWRCQRDGGHVVGELVDVTLEDGAGRVKALRLYEQAVTVPPEEVPPLRAAKLFHAEGLRCSICDMKFDWYPSLPSLIKLLKRYEEKIGDKK
jgi:hypothetical protein